MLLLSAPNLLSIVTVQKAASIGFQVPIALFDSSTVIANGFLLALALFGKVAVGPLLTPVFDGSKEHHKRDMAVVGFSMAGEAEFAFVVAVFGLTEGLTPPDRYASVVWAILLSTVLSPLALRTTLALYSDDKDPSVDGGGSSRLGEVDGDSDCKKSEFLPTDIEHLSG